MKYITIIIALISIVFTGCEDKLLELTPISENTTDNFYITESDFNSAMNAAYNGLQTINEIDFKMTEVRSDNCYSKRSTAGFNIDDFQLAPTNIYVAEYWEKAYNAIFRANIILDKIVDADISAEKKSQYIGEAKFIRALIYFDLVRFFGDVPLVTSVVKLSESFDVRRAPIADVYTQIITDLRDATSLPSSYDNNVDKGRATSVAANGLLGKVYLTLGDFDMANDALDVVINNPNYDLLPTFEEVFSVENENGIEDIFSIQYSNGAGNGNGFNYLYGPKVEGADILVGVGQATIRPTAELMRVFEEGDTRKKKTYSPYTANPINNDTITDAYFRKFLSTDLLLDGGQNWPVLRYADVLLMKAEVLNELNDLPGAIVQLNEVRSRAFEGDSDKLYDIANVSDKETMKEVILNERRLELAAENQRWFDLLRFGKAEEFLQEEIRTEDFRTGQDLQTQKCEMKPHQNLYPIPTQEIERSGISQNSGY
jgi:hypothetical protein